MHMGFVEVKDNLIENLHFALEDTSTKTTNPKSMTKILLKPIL